MSVAGPAPRPPRSERRGRGGLTPAFAPANGLAGEGAVGEADVGELGVADEATQVVEVAGGDGG